MTESGHDETAGTGLEVFTVGHSTLTADDLIRLLKAHDIEAVADIRSVPRSRRNPQFDGEALAATLAAEGIVYAHLRELGGFRRSGPDSPNAGLRHPSFRGYADHMMTDEFEAGVELLLELAGTARTAALCAEANPMRCHRRLLSDALTARGVRVRHITGPRSASEHRLTDEAEVSDGRVTYPEREPPLF